MEINSDDQCKANFRIVKLSDPSINFEAEALPRSGGFKLRWTKEEKRNLKDCARYRIKIEKIDNESKKVTLCSPNKEGLTSNMYKWDIREVDPDKRYTMNISLHFYKNGQIVEEPFAAFQLLNCQSYISELQYKNLFLKAKNFCSQKEMTKFTHFYRAEMKENWEKYTTKGKCDLKTHKKKLYQGHRVPGMDRIPGVSFFARHRLPDFSPFGDTIAVIPTECLMQYPFNFEFFFMDIKCYEKESGLERTHYIVIIIAKKGSPEEKYCRKRMGDPLDKMNNPFLRIEKDDSEKFTFFMPSKYLKCFLEVFFVQQTGFLTFDWKKVEQLAIVKDGKRKLPYEECLICSPFKSVEDIPSSSFKNQSYPSTPESEEKEMNIIGNEVIGAGEDDSEEMHFPSSSLQSQTLSPMKRQNSTSNPKSTAPKQNKSE